MSYSSRPDLLRAGCFSPVKSSTDFMWRWSKRSMLMQFPARVVYYFSPLLTFKINYNFSCLEFVVCVCVRALWCVTDYVNTHFGRA